MRRNRKRGGWRPSGAVVLIKSMLRASSLHRVLRRYSGHSSLSRLLFGEHNFFPIITFEPLSLFSVMFISERRSKGRKKTPIPKGIQLYTRAMVEYDYVSRTIKSRGRNKLVMTRDGINIAMQFHSRRLVVNHQFIKTSAR